MKSPIFKLVIIFEKEQRVNIRDIVTDGESGPNTIKKLQEGFHGCGYDGFSLELDFLVKKDRGDILQRYDEIRYVLRWIIYKPFFLQGCVN